MQSSNTPDKLVLPFAASGAKNTIPAASQIGITAGKASLTDGFPPLTRTPLSAGGVPPSGLDMNGILYEMSAVIRWANAGGGYPFDAVFATDANVGGYPKGARIMRSDGLGYWFNTAENQTVDPESAGAAAAGWVPDYTYGVAAIAMASSNVTLTPLQYGKPIIVISGTLTANLNLIFPNIAGEWTVVNGASGAFSVTCKTAAGTGVALPTGYARGVYGDGTNIGASENASDLISIDLANKTSAAKGSALVGYFSGETGSAGRTVHDKLHDFINVKDFGAKGDGTTDDTSAIQSAINAVLNNGGGIIYFPASPSHYRITASLLIDYSGAFYATNRFSKKIHLIGDSSTSTYIVPDSGAYSAINLIGNSTDNAAYFRIKGIRLSGVSPVAGSIGLAMSRAAYVTLDDVIVEVFATGVFASDVEQIGIYDSEIRYNTVGVSGVTGTMTSPNSWSFYNTLLAGNTKGGAYISNANAFNYNGGSVQYNGYIGAGADGYGIQIVDAGNGYGTIGFTNMVFEGNGGLGDFVNGQGAYPSNVSFDNVSFMRTVGFFSATVTGAANNGSGAIRLTVDSTAALAGKPKVCVYGVVGTTEANNIAPWSFTVIDGTHIDLVGSTFTNAYVSGGKVSIVGFGTNNILADGSAANSIYGLRNCTFKYGIGYPQSAARPTIYITNPNAKFLDDGSNYFKSSIEKLTYTEAQRIGDDGSSWATYSPTATAAGGTFTATAVGKVKKIGKTVYFEAVITTTSYTATPTAPLTVTLPYPAASYAVTPVMNSTTLTNATGLISSGLSTARIWKDGVFPINANGQILVISGVYETT